MTTHAQVMVKLYDELTYLKKKRLELDDKILLVESEIKANEL